MDVLFTDAHTHLQMCGACDKVLNDDACGVAVVCSTSAADMSAVLALCALRPPPFGFRQLLPALGVHPWEARSWGTAASAALAAGLDENIFASIGEVGLDSSPRGLAAAPADVQAAALAAQLLLAATRRRPVQMHVVRAHEAAAAALAASPPVAVLLHSFGGGPADAVRYAALEPATRVLFSFQGSIVAPVAAAFRKSAGLAQLETRPRGASKATLAVLAAANATALAFETDSPSQPFADDVEYMARWHTPLLHATCAALGCAPPAASELAVSEAATHSGGCGGCSIDGGGGVGVGDIELKPNNPRRVLVVLLAAATWRARSRTRPLLWPTLEAAAAEASVLARAAVANVASVFG